MKKLFLFTVLLYQLLSLNAQTPQAILLADSLIKAGTFKVAVTNYEFSPRIKILQDSIIARLNRNAEWKGKNLLHLIEQGNFRDLTFMKEYGITREEYNEMMFAFRQKKQPVYSDSVPITITFLKGIITFKAKGKAAILNYLNINVNTKIISFEEQFMSIEYNAFGKFYAPSLHGIETLSGYDGKILEGYKPKTKIDLAFLTVGYNEKDGKPTFTFGVLNKIPGEPLPGIDISTFTIFY